MSASIETRLDEHPFLRGLDPKLIRALLPHACDASFDAGELILREGDAASATFLVVEGRIALEIHAGPGAVKLATVGPGEVVGWSWLAAPNRWHFDARAIEPVRAVVLDGTTLAKACEANHDLGYALLRRFLGVVTQRIEAMRLQLLDVYGDHTWA